jgi:hypothetical protein
MHFKDSKVQCICGANRLRTGATVLLMDYASKGDMTGIKTKWWNVNMKIVVVQTKKEGFFKGSS